MHESPKIAQNRTADSVFYELTRSLCPECKQVIDAQIHLKDNRGIMRKRCPSHGWFEALVSSDADGYVNSLKYNKRVTIPLEFTTEVKDGCPYDCGLCPEHKQHACVSLIEVNTGCNLASTTCFANAGPGFNLTLDQVDFMLDQFVRTEGDPEVVQFSGGEPTIHPQLLEMIRMAQDKGIRHVIVNTNGRLNSQRPGVGRSARRTQTHDLPPVRRAGGRDVRETAWRAAAGREDGSPRPAGRAGPEHHPSGRD